MATKSTAAAPPFELPVELTHGRVLQGIADLNLDAVNANRGATPHTILKTLDDPSINDEFIDKLWNDPGNADVVNAFMKNDFVWYAARNPDNEALSYYQTYGIQDYFYLIDYVRFKALRLNTVLDSDWKNLQAEAESLSSSVKWVNDWRKTLTTDMKVSDETIDNAERSVGELAYANVLQRHASIDDWFDLHVIMIPCIFGWPKLAKAVDEDKNTLKDTIFYKTWVQPNMDTSSATKLSAFLDANDDMWGAGVDQNQGTKLGKWNSLFRTAMKLEVALFRSSGYPVGAAH